MCHDNKRKSVNLGNGPPHSQISPLKLVWMGRSAHWLSGLRTPLWWPQNAALGYTIIILQCLTGLTSMHFIISAMQHSTFTMQTFHMMKYSLKYAPDAKAGANFMWKFQPITLEQCFNFLNTLPLASESLCNGRIYLQWKKLFYKFWFLSLPPAC